MGAHGRAAVWDSGHGLNSGVVVAVTQVVSELSQWNVGTVGRSLCMHGNATFATTEQRAWQWSMTTNRRILQRQLPRVNDVPSVTIGLP